MQLHKNDLKMLLWIYEWDDARNTWLQTQQAQKQFFKHNQDFYLTVERLNAFHLINGNWMDATYRITMRGRWIAFRNSL